MWALKGYIFFSFVDSKNTRLNLFIVLFKSFTGLAILFCFSHYFLRDFYQNFPLTWGFCLLLPKCLLVLALEFLLLFCFLGGGWGLLKQYFLLPRLSLIAMVVLAFICCVTDIDFEFLLILLPQPPWCWGGGCALPCHA